MNRVRHRMIIEFGIWLDVCVDETCIDQRLMGHYLYIRVFTEIFYVIYLNLRYSSVAVINVRRRYSIN